MAHDHVAFGVEDLGEVPDRAVGVEELLRVALGVQVASADPAGDGLDQQLAGVRGRRLRDLGDDQFAVAQHDCSHHVLLMSV